MRYRKRGVRPIERANNIWEYEGEWPAFHKNQFSCVVRSNSSSASCVESVPSGAIQFPATGHIGAAKFASGLRRGGICSDVSDAILSLDRLPCIGRLGRGSPEIGEGPAAVLDQVCGSGISIAHAKSFDRSATLVKSDGRRTSIPNEFTDPASLAEKLIPAGGARACVCESVESVVRVGIGSDEG